MTDPNLYPDDIECKWLPLTVKWITKRTYCVIVQDLLRSVDINGNGSTDYVTFAVSLSMLDNTTVDNEYACNYPDQSGTKFNGKVIQCRQSSYITNIEVGDTILCKIRWSFNPGKKVVQWNIYAGRCDGKNVHIWKYTCVDHNSDRHNFEEKVLEGIKKRWQQPVQVPRFRNVKHAPQAIRLNGPNNAPNSIPPHVLRNNNFFSNSGKYPRRVPFEAPRECKRKAIAAPAPKPRPDPPAAPQCKVLNEHKSRKSKPKTSIELLRHNTKMKYANDQQIYYFTIKGMPWTLDWGKNPAELSKAERSTLRNIRKMIVRNKTNLETVQAILAALDFCEPVFSQK